MVPAFVRRLWSAVAGNGPRPGAGPQDAAPGRIACRTDPLRKTTAADLAALFASEAIARDWEQDGAAIERLQLPDLTGGVNRGDQRAIYYLIHGAQAAQGA